MATTRINDGRDVDNTNLINETVSSYATWAFNHLRSVLGEVYPLVIRPVGNGLAGFFKGEDGNYRLYQPFADLAMIPGNAAMAIADGFLPLSPKGGIGLPTAPIIGRLVQTGQLMTDMTKQGLTTFQRFQLPIAAVAASSLAVYLGLQSMSVANGLLVPGQNLAANLTFDPTIIIKNLMESDQTLYHKLLIGVAGYIGATNGFVLGKELVLNDLQAWWRSLWADVRKDHVIRHLDHLSKLSPEAAVLASQEYHRAVEASKNWNLVDVSGRSLERLLRLPSALFSTPSHNIRHMTVPKGWLNNNGFVKGGVDAVNMGGNYVSERTPDSIRRTANIIVGLLGWDNQKQAVAPKDNHYPTYAQLLEDKKKEYWILPSPLNGVANFFGDGKRSEREQKLDVEFIDQYTQDVANNMQKLKLSAPVMPREKPLIPVTPEWATLAAANEHIKQMLAGVFPEAMANAPLYKKARHYNEALYSVYSTGEYRPEVAHVVGLKRE